MKPPEGMSKEEWIAWVRDRYEKEEEQERERKEASNGATTGFWRPTTTDEVHSPGRSYRMNLTTGVSEVFEPPGMTPPPDDLPPPPPPGRNSNGNTFFRNVNNAALNNIAAWVQALHPNFQDRGDSGWRLSSKDLDHDLEGDILVHPDGIRDFGEEKPLTAIGLVMKLGAAPDPTAAAFWLCDKLEIMPGKLGWPGLTLAQYAEAKRLPIDFLQSKFGLRDVTYRGAPAVEMPYYGEPGAETYVVKLRVALADIGGMKKTRWRYGHKARLYGLWRLPEFKKRNEVILVEGESDTHTCWLPDFPTLGLPGAGGWNEERDAGLLDGISNIYAVIEPDQAAANLLDKLAASAIRDRLRIVRMRSEIKDPSALYLLNPENFVKAFRQLLDAAEPPPPPPPPCIEIVAGERHVAADQGIAALVAACVPFYQRDHKIQRIATVKAKNTSGETMMVPGIISVTGAMMGRALGQAARWEKYDRRSKKIVPIDPPGAVSQQILSMVGEWPFQPLNGIVQCPTLRRDGSLLATEGYDQATGLMLVGNVKMPQISKQPTRDDAESALKLLLSLLDEFPFVDAESKSVALSMIITPVARAAMTVAPMHLVRKPLPGTGGSYLADIASMIATGERCAVETMAPEYAETEKRLIGSALSGFPIIALDNCRGVIEGDFFCQVVERPLMNLRALGKSDKHRIPNTYTFFANGNNTPVAEDLVRRTVGSTLDANMEHPEERTFKGNPLAAALKNRGDYIAAALTIPLAYRCKQPDQFQAPTPLASFEEWSHVVREPLIWLGCVDPVKTQAKLREADPKKGELAAVLEAWKSDLGVGKGRMCRTADILDALEKGMYPALHAALLKVAPQRFGHNSNVDPLVLGKWLAKHEGRIAGGVKLMVDRADAARPKWYVNFVDKKDDDHNG